jgi:hypothetical protein
MDPNRVGAGIAHWYSDGLWLDGQGLIPGSGKIFLFPIASRPALRPTQPLIQWVLGLFPQGLKQQVCEADHSPASSAKVKNGGATCSHPYASSWCVA